MSTHTPGAYPPGSAAAAFPDDYDGSRYLASRHIRLVRPTHRMHPKAPWCWTVEAIWNWMMIAAVQVGWYFYGDNVFSFWNQVAAVITVAAAAVSIVVLPWWRYRVHAWESTEDALYAQSGWMTVHNQIVPLTRLQTIHSKRTIFERAFGLATVIAVTASSSGNISIRGLHRTDADELVAQLTDSAAADESDAT